MNMKKLFLKTLQFSLLLTLLLGSTLTWCADTILQEPAAAHALPAAQSNAVVDATYATKNLLSSIMEAFPHLTVQEALLQSALLGIIAEPEVQLHMYGTFTTEQNPAIPGRTMRVFDTHTPLNNCHLQRSNSSFIKLKNPAFYTGFFNFNEETC